MGIGEYDWPKDGKVLSTTFGLLDFYITKPETLGKFELTLLILNLVIGFTWVGGILAG